MAKVSKAEAHPSPYYMFCREQRPLLPARLKNRDRETLLGQNWRKLSEAGRATYERGLTRLPCSGRGGLREWAPTPPTKLPTPPSGAVSATFLAGCAAADSASDSALVSISAERTAKTAPPSPDPEDQPAAERRAYPDGQGGVSTWSLIRQRADVAAVLHEGRLPPLPAGTNNTDREKVSKAEAHPSPYYMFCREQRPLLPARLKNRDRETLLGQNWRKLSEAGRATYKRGLTRLPSSGRGGFRGWALSQPAAVSVSDETEAQAESATETATETAAAQPEDQPAAKRRAYQDDQGGSHQHAHSAPPASLPPFRSPAVEQAVAPQEGGGGGGGASESELERRGGQGER
eukprot:scaffold4819_cov46-Phaeocystis_antarctica.AAC.1